MFATTIAPPVLEYQSAMYYSYVQMSRYNVSFIDDNLLYSEVKKVLDVAALASDRAEVNLHTNIVDPFSAVFDSMRQGISLTDWLEQEKARQVQKTLQNALGDFHQSILGHVPGWVNLKVGGVADLRSDDRKVVAEVKNKFNTTKGNHKKVIYDDLLGLITSLGEDYVGYYVEIIPKSRVGYDKPFTPSDNVTGSRRPQNERIRVIDGRSFYRIVTGEDDALDRLYATLPLVVADVLSTRADLVANDPAYTDLYRRAYPFL